MEGESILLEEVTEGVAIVLCTIIQETYVELYGIG